MEPDDDVHYSLVGLGVMEQHGPEFSWKEVATYWLAHLPAYNFATAEARALLNFQNQNDRLEGPATPAYCRHFRNPFRERIGAQIRADGWAWCAAGRPELAAEFAWRDASWTHERNGIYGAMMFAAIQAAAFVEHDPRRLVEIGLSEIPAACRLALAVRKVLAWLDEGMSLEACVEALEAAFADMHGVHVINNAALCVLALCSSAGLGTVGAVTSAVTAGLDTDCNGATVGSIVGAAAGASALQTTIASKLNDRVQAGMIGFSDVTLTELAERTAIQWSRVNTWAKSARFAP